MDVDESFTSTTFNVPLIPAHHAGLENGWVPQSRLAAPPDALFSKLRVASPDPEPPQAGPSRYLSSSVGSPRSPRAGSVPLDPFGHQEQSRPLVLTGDGREHRRRRRGEPRRRNDEFEDEQALSPIPASPQIGEVAQLAAPEASPSARQSQHLSLHQHHYAAPQLEPPLPSHWWRQEAPAVLLGYTQVAFNASIVVVALAILFSFLRAIATDAGHKVQRFSDEIAQEILQCANAYTANNCSPDTRVPMMEAMCAQYEHCMQRNAAAVPRARVVAETVAETIDAFVGAISWRTMLFLLMTCGLIVTLTNATMVRARHDLQRETAREIALERERERQLRANEDRPALQHSASAPTTLTKRRGWFK